MGASSMNGTGTDLSLRTDLENNNPSDYTRIPKMQHGTVDFGACTEPLTL